MVEEIEEDEEPASRHVIAQFLSLPLWCRLRETSAPFRERQTLAALPGVSASPTPQAIKQVAFSDKTCRKPARVNMSPSATVWSPSCSVKSSMSFYLSGADDEIISVWQARVEAGLSIFVSRPGRRSRFVDSCLQIRENRPNLPLADK